MRVALVHDWLVAHRGGEAVLLELARMFPSAPIYTLVADKHSIHPELADREIKPSFIQGFPGSPDNFRNYLPLFPQAIEQMDFTGYDLVLSTSHCVAKGVNAGDVPHFSYIHTPMRYIWDQRGHYAPKGISGILARPAFELFAAWMRRWDRKSALRPTGLMANSGYVANRVKTCWGRNAQVIYPPVDTAYFKPGTLKRKPYLAVVGAQVGYKNNQLAVEFARASGRELKVVGAGPGIDKMKAGAGTSASFEGHVTRERLREIYQEAHGLLFCGVEDFGIVPVEAIASGCPVIAYAEGGALETVQAEGDHPTGVFFADNTVTAVKNAVRVLDDRWGAGVFDPEQMHKTAQRFSPEAFRQNVAKFLDLSGFDKTVL